MLLILHYGLYIHIDVHIGFSIGNDSEYFMVENIALHGAVELLHSCVYLSS